MSPIQALKVKFGADQHTHFAGDHKHLKFGADQHTHFAGDHKHLKFGDTSNPVLGGGHGGSPSLTQPTIGGPGSAIAQRLNLIA